MLIQYIHTGLTKYQMSFDGALVNRQSKQVYAECYAKAVLLGSIASDLIFSVLSFSGFILFRRQKQTHSERQGLCGKGGNNSS